MDLITQKYAWNDGDGLAEFSQDDVDQIRDLLVGHTVAKVADDHLRLDDGTLLRIVPNDGGCSCGAGDYELTDLNEVDNIITAVTLEKEGAEEYGEFSGSYRIFVLAGDKKINLVSVTGDDGNGYYGTGYSILVRKPKVGA